MKFTLLVLFCGQTLAATTEFILDTFKRFSVKDAQSNATFELLVKKCKEVTCQDTLSEDDYRDISKMTYKLESSASNKKERSMILVESLEISSLDRNDSNIILRSMMTMELPNHQICVPKFFPNRELVENMIEETYESLPKSLSSSKITHKTVLYSHVYFSLSSHLLDVFAYFAPLYIDLSNDDQVKEMLKFFGDMYGKVKSTIHHIHKVFMELKLIENDCNLEVDKDTISTFIPMESPSLFTARAGPLKTHKWTLDILDLITPSNARLVVENIQRRQRGSSYDKYTSSDIKDRLHKLEFEEEQNHLDVYPVYLNCKNPAVVFSEDHSKIMVGLHPILHLLLNTFISTRISNINKLHLLHRVCLADLVKTTVHSRSILELPIESTILPDEFFCIETQLGEILDKLDPEFGKDFEAIRQSTEELRAAFENERIFMHSVEVKPSMSALEMVEYLAKMVQLCDKFKSQSGMLNVRAALVNLIKVSVPVLKKWIGLEESKLIKVLKPIFY